MVSSVAAAMISAALVIAAPSSPSEPSPTTNNRILLDANGYVSEFYGVPMDLKLSDLKHYRHKADQLFSEGEPYTVYTIKAEEGVVVELSFDSERLSWVNTSSPNAIGPKGIGVGSLLSQVKAAWPEGKLFYGVEENTAFVAYNTSPREDDPVMYWFRPEDMPPEAFDRSRGNREIDVPDITVVKMGISPPPLPPAD